jgi:hypothetical protein
MNYIVMEYIEGDTLDKVWDEMKDEERIKICTKLAEQLRLIRTIPSPGYYGRIHHQPFPRGLEALDTPRNKIISETGPFHTYAEFCKAVYDATECYT